MLDLNNNGIKYYMYATYCIHNIIVAEYRIKNITFSTGF